MFILLQQTLSLSGLLSERGFNPSAMPRIVTARGEGRTEDEMVTQCHRRDQQQFDTIPGGSGRQEGLACSGPWGHEESDTA